MRTGYVRETGEGLIPFQAIYVEGTGGNADTFIAAIDTGFTGELALPPEVRENLGLEYCDSVYAVFANSAVEAIDRFEATVFWNNDWRQITVLETGDRPLIGMELLRGSSVCFNAIESGEIDISLIDPNNT